MRISALTLALLGFASTSAAAQKLPKDSIVTKDGQMLVARIQEADRFPPGCATPRTPDCDEVQPGYKIVVIWLKAVDSTKTDSLMWGLMNSFEAIQLVASDGSKTKGYKGGRTRTGLFVAFTPLANVQVQSLEWPGNRPIQLSRP